MKWYKRMVGFKQGLEGEETLDLAITIPVGIGAAIFVTLAAYGFIRLRRRYRLINKPVELASAEQELAGDSPRPLAPEDAQARQEVKV